MSTIQRTETMCDFCGHAGPYTRSEDFTRLGDFDFCRWCADGERKAWMESGGHRVTFREGRGWDCGCGMSTDRWAVGSLRVLTLPAVLAVLPRFDNATASMHFEGRF